MTKAKRRIIDASYELFRERSFDAIRISDIVNRASVVKGTFYNNFQNKQELLSMFCADYISECILSRYDGHNWDMVQMNCFALGYDHKDFFQGIRSTSENDEFWSFIHLYFSRIIGNIKRYNSGGRDLTDKEQLTIDTYVNSAIYLFRNRMLLGFDATYEDIAGIISGYLSDDYKVIDDPDADPASIIIPDNEELIKSICQAC